jgi:hypothetical protein
MDIVHRRLCEVANDCQIQPHKAFPRHHYVGASVDCCYFLASNGVLKTFKASNMGQITKAVFWFTLWSLDVALKIKRIGFANHLLVSAELVKFLTVNSRVEAIEQLQTHVDTLETQLTEATKVAKAANKAATKACNKLDVTKTAHEALMKRVAKLE